MDGLGYEGEKRRSHVPPSITTSALPGDINVILRKMMQNNDALISQNAALLSLLSGSGDSLSSPANVPSSPYHHHQFLEQAVSSTDDDKWGPILSTSSATASEFTETYFDWPRPPTLAAVLSERRTWTSWSYRASFPHLAKFLARASMAGKQGRCPCQVVMEDYRTIGGEVRTVVLGKASSRVEELWKGVRVRLPPNNAVITEQMGRGSRGVSARLWSIFDLSPVVLACLLGSTPQ